MRVLMVSKALVVAEYRRKLTQLGRLGVDVHAVMPSMWREGGSEQRLESASDDGYHSIVCDLRFNGHFHLHYYPQLGRIIRRLRPDIVHIDEEPFNFATFHAALLARRAGIPVLFFTWQNLLRRYPPPFRDMERSVYRWSYHALAGSEDAAQVLRHKGFAGSLSIVPQFGVDPDRFSPADVRVPPRPFTVGFLNRLIPAKAPLETLDAFSRLPPDSRLHYVGDGPLADTLRAAIIQRNLSDRVTVQARVPSAEMPALYRSLDAVTLPSLTTPSWKEQFGRVLIEAMAAGVPTIGSNSGEIPRVIGDAGLVIPEGDVAALARALRRLKDDPDLRVDLGRRGRERVLSRFTHAAVARDTLAVYRQA